MEFDLLAPDVGRVARTHQHQTRLIRDLARLQSLDQQLLHLEYFLPLGLNSMTWLLVWRRKTVHS